MAAPRVKIAKDWFTEANQKTPQRTRMVNLFEQTKVTKADELPVLLTAKEVAQHLKLNPKTASAMMKAQEIRSVRLRGRRFSTPEWIADFMRNALNEGS